MSNINELANLYYDFVKEYDYKLEKLTLKNSGAKHREENQEEYE